MIEMIFFLIVSWIGFVLTACSIGCANCRYGSFCTSCYSSYYLRYNACYPKRYSGDSCFSHSECFSRYCVSGRCCTGRCYTSCDSSGTCLLYEAGTLCNYGSDCKSDYCSQRCCNEPCSSTGVCDTAGNCTVLTEAPTPVPTTVATTPVPTAVVYENSVLVHADFAGGTYLSVFDTDAVNGTLRMAVPLPDVGSAGLSYTSFASAPPNADVVVGVSIVLSVHQCSELNLLTPATAADPELHPGLVVPSGMHQQPVQTQPLLELSAADAPKGGGYVCAVVECRAAATCQNLILGLLVNQRTTCSNPLVAYSVSGQGQFLLVASTSAPVRLNYTLTATVGYDIVTSAVATAYPPPRPWTRLSLAPMDSPAACQQLQHGTLPAGSLRAPDYTRFNVTLTTASDPWFDGSVEKTACVLAETLEPSPVLVAFLVDPICGLKKDFGAPCHHPGQCLSTWCPQLAPGPHHCCRSFTCSRCNSTGHCDVCADSFSLDRQDGTCRPSTEAPTPHPSPPTMSPTPTPTWIPPPSLTASVTGGGIAELVVDGTASAVHSRWAGPSATSVSLGVAVDPFFTVPSTNDWVQSPLAGRSCQNAHQVALDPYRQCARVFERMSPVSGSYRAPPFSFLFSVSDMPLPVTGANPFANNVSVSVRALVRRSVVTNRCSWISGKCFSPSGTWTDARAWLAFWPSYNPVVQNPLVIQLIDPNPHSFVYDPKASTNNFWPLSSTVGYTVEDIGRLFGDDFVSAAAADFNFFLDGVIELRLAPQVGWATNSLSQKLAFSAAYCCADMQLAVKRKPSNLDILSLPVAVAQMDDGRNWLPPLPAGSRSHRLLLPLNVSSFNDNESAVLSSSVCQKSLYEFDVTQHCPAVNLVVGLGKCPTRPSGAVLKGLELTLGVRVSASGSGDSLLLNGFTSTDVFNQTELARMQSDPSLNQTDFSSVAWGGYGFTPSSWADLCPLLQLHLEPIAQCSNCSRSLELSRHSNFAVHFTVNYTLCLFETGTASSLKYLYLFENSGNGETALLVPNANSALSSSSSLLLQLGASIGPDGTVNFGSGQSGLVPLVEFNRNLAVSVWVKLTNAETTAVPLFQFIAAKATGGQGFLFQLAPIYTGIYQELQLLLHDGTSSSLFASTGPFAPLSTGHWHHVGLVIASLTSPSSFVTFVVNGCAMENFAPSSSQTAAVGQFIGNQGELRVGPDPFVGQMDSLAIYSDDSSPPTLLVVSIDELKNHGLLCRPWTALDVDCSRIVVTEPATTGIFTTPTTPSTTLDPQQQLELALTQQQSSTGDEDPQQTAAVAVAVSFVVLVFCCLAGALVYFLVLRPRYQQQRKSSSDLTGQTICNGQYLLTRLLADHGSGVQTWIITLKAENDQSLCTLLPVPVAAVTSVIEQLESLKLALVPLSSPTKKLICIERIADSGRPTVRRRCWVAIVYKNALLKVHARHTVASLVPSLFRVMKLTDLFPTSDAAATAAAPSSVQQPTVEQRQDDDLYNSVQSTQPRRRSRQTSRRMNRSMGSKRASVVMQPLPSRSAISSFASDPSCLLDEIDEHHCQIWLGIMQALAHFHTAAVGPLGHVCLDSFVMRRTEAPGHEQLVGLLPIGPLLALCCSSGHEERNSGAVVDDWQQLLRLAGEAIQTTPVSSAIARLPGTGTALSMLDEKMRAGAVEQEQVIQFLTGFCAVGSVQQSVTVVQPRFKSVFLSRERRMMRNYMVVSQGLSTGPLYRLDNSSSEEDLLQDESGIAVGSVKKVPCSDPLFQSLQSWLRGVLVQDLYSLQSAWSLIQPDLMQAAAERLEEMWTAWAPHLLPRQRTAAGKPSRYQQNLQLSVTDGAALLFHYTKPGSMMSIASGGFDSSFCKPGPGARFGVGLYFSPLLEYGLNGYAYYVQEAWLCDNDGAQCKAVAMRWVRRSRRLHAKGDQWVHREAYLMHALSGPPSSFDVSAYPGWLHCSQCKLHVSWDADKYNPQDNYNPQQQQQEPAVSSEMKVAGEGCSTSVVLEDPQSLKTVPVPLPDWAMAWLQQDKRRSVVVAPGFYEVFACTVMVGPSEAVHAVNRKQMEGSFCSSQSCGCSVSPHTVHVTANKREVIVPVRKEAEKRTTDYQAIPRYVLRFAPAQVQNQLDPERM